MEANRTLAWFAVFALGLALARLAPGPLGARCSAACSSPPSIVCGYALLTKVFPGALNPDEIYARLREPFGYWNSVGLLAAMGVPAACGSARAASGHAALNALAFPALGLLLVVALLLAYSRGSLLALGVGCAFWFALVPLRLRGVAGARDGGLGGLLVGLWAFGQDGAEPGPRAARPARRRRPRPRASSSLRCSLVLAGRRARGRLRARRARAAARRRGAASGSSRSSALALVPVARRGVLATSDARPDRQHLATASTT